MALTTKQEAYARSVAAGDDLHKAALKAGCKNHEAARKFVADMATRENVQAFIHELKQAQTGLLSAKVRDDASGNDALKYETPLQFLTAVFNNTDGLYTPKERINAAIALLPYTEQKLAQTGKKQDEADVAKQQSEQGRFATLSHQPDMFFSELVQ